MVSTVAHLTKSSPSRSPLPPGPEGYSLIGVVPDPKDWITFITRMARDCDGVVYYRFFAIPVCYLNHPDYIEQRDKHIEERLIKEGPK